MQLTVERLGKTSFIVQSRGHLILSDQPRDNGGTDTAMNPPELLLASLGTCVGYYVVQFCDARNLDSSRVEVTVSGEILHDPGRIGKIDLRIRLPLDLDPERKSALLKAIGHCTVHNTLKIAPDIRFELETATS